MPITNFPYGLSSYGFPLIGSGPVLTTGDVFFVNGSTGVDADGRGTDPSTPFKTIDYAIGKCEANKGDVIFAMPGHTETVASAGAITCDVAGVTIIGIGNGDERPTISLTGATTATIVVSAKNVKWVNFYFDMRSAVDSVATCFDVSAGWFTVQDSRFLMSDGTYQAVAAVKFTNAAADYCKVLNCDFLAPVAGATAAISSAVAIDELEIAGCKFYGDFATAAINNTVAALTNVNLHHNIYYGTNASEPIIELYTGGTGMIYNNFSGAATFAAAGSIVADTVYKFENYITDTAANSGILDPTGVTL